MKYPQAYIDYLIYFHVTRDYFECHEVLEEHWKKDPQENRKQHWVALIQLAVALYHHRRGNKQGAKTMYERVVQLISDEQVALTGLDLDVFKLLDQIQKQQAALQAATAFSNLDLPMTNQLVQACEKRCPELLAVSWSVNHAEVPNEIVNKHRERDLQAVIDEREKQLALRQAKREKKKRL